MAGSDETSAGQRCGSVAMKQTATIRQRRPRVKIKFRWCPASKGVSVIDQADEWAPLAEVGPYDHGVEHLRA